MTQRRLHPIAVALSLALTLTSSVTDARAGESLATGGRTSVLADKALPHSPLSFLGGRLIFDAHARTRWETRENNFDFNDDLDSPTDDNWFLLRFRLGVMLKPARWLKVYAQGQDAREWLSDRPDFPGQLAAEGDDTFDLRQGYIEFGDPTAFPLTLKVGRQILSYGDERLIGAFEWNNIGRTFDAVKLRWEEKKWSLDAFASSAVVPARGQYNQSDFYNGNETDREQTFSGLYFSTTALSFQTTDLYALHLSENSNPRFLPDAPGDTSFVTFGLRIKSKPGFFASAPGTSDGKQVADGKSMPPPPKPVGFDYDVEVAYQTGEVRGLDLTSFAVHAGIGYTLDAPWIPRLGLAYNFGSGDKDPLDREIETFQNLFPTNHKFYGQMDVFSWQNMHDLEASIKAQPMKAVTLKAEYHAFWLASTDDVWYRANGVTPVRPLTPAAQEASNYAGSEVDLLVQWAITKAFTVEAGYSHFFAGDYLANTGASDDADFGYVMATVTF
ncbi:MAG TPA: alginate export family protein [Chthoniobacteraceae bacterium]|nr:alginate export family protein [Chthoniobacteraceae bacterium]